LLITVVVIAALAVVAVAAARTPMVAVAAARAPMVAVAARAATASPLSVNETPLEAGAPTALSLRTTFDRSTRGELSAVEVDLARGFRFDPRAAGVCSNAQARAAMCPEASTIGLGEGTIVVQGRYLPRTPYSVGATFYLAKARHPGDIAGLVLDLYEPESQLHATILGRVVPLPHGPYGLALRFAAANMQLPSGYDLSLLTLTTLLQAHRNAVVNHRGVAYDLLTNPSACARRGWPVQLAIRSGGRLQGYQSKAACAS
jgi:hypothetical protein